MKFLVDMPLSPRLSHWLAQQGHDAVHASDVGMERASDAQLLQRALLEQRTVITADLDYPRLLASTQAEGPGLILFRGGNYAEDEVVERMKAALRTIPLDELAESIVVVEKSRIRRRRLPI
ncbi:MAG: DUF5615 family PIN-like protein [Chloroflexi bacterium]|nr:DUF5615 family PIN-like protein [Chloroflexota bacterium]